MADFFGEFVIELIKFVVGCAFEPCHTQRGCVLSLLTLLTLVSMITFLVIAGTLAKGAAAIVCCNLAAVCGILFVALGAVMIWSKCVDEPKA